MMRARICAVAVVASIVMSSGADAQYRTGTIYSQTLQNKWPISCSADTVYDPEVYVLPGGDLRLLAQGSNQGLVDSGSPSVVEIVGGKNGGVVDLSSVYAAYPGAQVYYPGAYFKSAWDTGVAGNYLFIPIDVGNGCPGDDQGLRIISTQLLY